MTETPISPRKSAPLSRVWRYALSGLLVATTLAGAYYHLLERAQLKQTSALFIGLPFVLGLLVIHLTRTQNVYGQVLRGNIVFLLIAAPLLGEGSICIIMAAPLFIGVSMVVVALARWVSRPTQLMLVAVPMVFGVFEKTGVPDPVVVETERTVKGDASVWRALVREAVPVPLFASAFLDLGFPRPVAYRQVEDGFRIDFQDGQKPSGQWSITPKPTPLGAQFLVRQDTTKIAGWLSLRRSQVEVVGAKAGKVIIRQRTTFVPRLYPLWYFVSAQKWAMTEAHRLAFETWQQQFELFSASVSAHAE